jgi:SlyX protein
MTTPNALSPAIDQRLIELEIKASYADDLLDVLNAQVARQQEQIELLLREVSHLRRQGDASAATATPPNAHDELPPHY